MQSKTGPVLLQIPRWRNPASTKEHLLVMAAKYTVLCQMRMWQQLAKKNGTTRATASMDKAASHG